MWTAFWLEIVIFISHKRIRVWKIFYKVVYHHIIYMCDFLVNLDDFLLWFARVFMKVVVSTRQVPFDN